MRSIRLVLATLFLLGLLFWGKIHLDHLRAQWRNFRALSDHAPGPAEKIGSVGSGGGSGSALSAEELGIVSADDGGGSGLGSPRPPETKFSTALQNTVNDKVIVVGKTKDEDTDWLIDDLPEYVSPPSKAPSIHYRNTADPGKMATCYLYSRQPRRSPLPPPK